MQRFDDVVDTHGRSLLELAAVLEGDTDAAVRLARAGLLRARRQWRRINSTANLYPSVRRELIAEFLSVGHRARRLLAPHLGARRHDRRAARPLASGAAPGPAATLRLTPVQWAVVALRQTEGLPDIRIADEVGCPIAEVALAADRALGRVARHGLRLPGSRSAAVATAEPAAVLREVVAARGGLCGTAELARLRAELRHSDPRAHHVRAVPMVAAAAVVGFAVLSATGPGDTPSAAVQPSRTSPPATMSADPAFAARGWYVLSRFQGALEEAAPPRLIVTGGLWEASNPKEAEAVAGLVRGRLRDEMPPIDDRAAVGTVRFPDGTESMTPVLGLHETFAELVREVPACRGCAPVVAAEGRLTSMSVRTPTGRALVPAQEFRIKGTHLRVRRLAIPRSSLVLLPPLPGGEGLVSIASVTPGPTTVHFAGMLTVRYPLGQGQVQGKGKGQHSSCVGEYRAVAVESQDAVAVTVLASRPAKARTPASCPPTGRLRTDSVRLTASLGKRVVLDGATGQPVPIGTQATAWRDPGSTRGRREDQTRR